jgi:hypothetical protein
MSTIELVWKETKSKNWAFQNNKYCLFLGILEMDKNYHWPRNTSPLTGASIPRLVKTGWISGIWFLINLPTITERCPYILLENCGLSLFCVSMSTNLTLVTYRGWVEGPQRTEIFPGVTSF